VRIIRATDEAIEVWRDDLTIPDGRIGEIVVQGPVVTNEYFERVEATRKAKIRAWYTEGPEIENADHGGSLISKASSAKSMSRSGGPVIHRMGDLGYRDDQGRIWFCGRKDHVVRTSEGPLHTIPVEAVFDTHADVNRTALVGIGPPGDMRPVLCVEPKDWKLSQRDGERMRGELRALGAVHPHTRSIDTFLFYKSFPVDVRHNAKIVREKLAVWAARRARSR
jgi:acyl-CoA synthetase (AMP-forming)/AMP-acid ligase II